MNLKKNMKKNMKFKYKEKDLLSVNKKKIFL
jgi:hypothetical protein